MTDERIRKLIQAELDGLISPEEEAALQQALSESPELRADYERDRALAGLLRADRASLEAPEGLAERVATAAKLRGRADERGGRVIAFNSFVRMSVAAAAVVVLAIGAFWMGTLQTSAQADTPERLDLRQRMHVLEAEYPGDAERIRELYRTCFDELERIGEDRDEAERQARGKLERAIDELLQGR